MERIPHPFVRAVTDQYEAHNDPRVRNIIWINSIHISNVSDFSVVCVSLFSVRESAVCHVCSLSLPRHDRYKLSAALGTSLATPDSVTGARDLNCSDHNLIIVPERKITATRIIDNVQTKLPNCNDLANYLFVVSMDHRSRNVF